MSRIKNCGARVNHTRSFSICTTQCARRSRSHLNGLVFAGMAAVGLLKIVLCIRTTGASKMRRAGKANSAGGGEVQRSSDPALPPKSANSGYARISIAFVVCLLVFYFMKDSANSAVEVAGVVVPRGRIPLGFNWKVSLLW